MGNYSSSEFGGLYIKTDKPYYFSGELVTGNIYLNIRKDGFPGQIVELIVSGKEKCKWEDKTGESTHHYKGKEQFYSHKAAIHTFSTPSLPKGQYTFPFQFSLQAHLPGSFFQKEDYYSAKINYKVKGQVVAYNKYNPMVNSQEILVREPLKNNIYAQQKEIEVKAKTWCCANQGTSHIKCVFNKDSYLPGDTAILWIDLDNSNCDLDVKEIRANLTNYLTLRDQRGQVKLIKRNVVQQSIEGISSRSTAINDNRKQMQMMLTDLNSQSGLKPSVHGQIITSKYELSVTAVLSGCTCCNAHPSVTVPIKIIAPVPISQNQPIQAPPDWNPQVFQKQLIQFAEKDMYAKNNGYNPQLNQMQQEIIQ